MNELDRRARDRDLQRAHARRPRARRRARRRAAGVHRPRAGRRGRRRPVRATRLPRRLDLEDDDAIAVMQLVEEGALSSTRRSTTRDAGSDRGARAGHRAPSADHRSGIGELRRRPTSRAGHRPRRQPGSRSGAGRYYAKPLRPGVLRREVGLRQPRLRAARPDRRGPARASVRRGDARADLRAARHGAHGLRAQRARARRLAVGYQRREGLQARSRTSRSSSRRRLCFSSAEDMARYVAALTGGGPPLLRRARWRACSSPGEPDRACPHGPRVLPRARRRRADRRP